MKKHVWISYDLGVKGDYEGLYTFLDSYDAKECGDNVAGFQFTYRENLLDELTEEINSHIELTKKTRIYVIRRENGKVKGRFIIGKRRTPPWSGYSQKSEDEEDTSE